MKNWSDSKKRADIPCINVKVNPNITKWIWKFGVISNFLAMLPFLEFHVAAITYRYLELEIFN